MVPYPLAITTIGVFVFSVWIIAFGITTGIAVKGFNSSLGSELSLDLDHTALVASSLIVAAETATIALFIWCCIKGQKRSDDQERDKLEEKIFYPTTPVVSLELCSVIRDKLSGCMP